MKKKTIHVISHSHWDREWYMPFEKHHMKLVELFQDAMELFQKGDGFKSFHLDGQTIVLDDFLDVCPEQREQVIQYVKDGRFQVGPWYILQDEFLTSGEANVRNLLIGRQESKEYGGLCNVGYFPDAFGNAGQMPQLLSQAGMKAIVFGRGVRPVGFNNQIQEGGSYHSQFSELNWKSPDGTGVLGILFANWYNNGNELPVEEEAAKAYWEGAIKRVEQFASTDQLLFMNGCDHQPVQKNLEEALDVARRLYPEYNFVHSNFSDYIDAVLADAGQEMSAVTGELTGQDTDGWCTLVNTCSSRVYLKQKNKKNEAKLEKTAEPLSVMAYWNGNQYPQGMLNYAWKTLMQNHPHDSICGCSVDPVHDEMMTRFEKSIQVADYVTQKSLEYLAPLIDRSMFPAGTAPFAVFNTTGQSRTDVVTVRLDLKRDYQGWTQGYQELEREPNGEWHLEDAAGNVIPAVITPVPVHFDYLLPDDLFRRTYMVKSVEVMFQAEHLPALGYRTYALLPGAAKAEESSLLTSETSMENQHLQVTVQTDGTLKVLHKDTGKTYTDLCYYEDTGDIGNEYIYKCPNGTEPILTKGGTAQIAVAEDSPFRAVLEIRNTLTVPASGDETLDREQKMVVGCTQRQAGRSRETTDLKLVTRVTLEKDASSLKVHTSFENTAKDHRLRVILPTDLETNTHLADSVFEVVPRPNRHGAEWTNPSGCEHQQAFVAMQDEKGGMMAANIGLYEYEVLPDNRNAMALTLLRAVGEMGDWGYFPTPKAQCLGPCEADFELVFYSGDGVKNNVYSRAYQFQTEIPYVQIDVPERKGCNHNLPEQKNILPADHGFLRWSGEGVALTGVKKAETGEDCVLRFINGGSDSTLLTVEKQPDWTAAYRSNVVEEELAPLEENGQGSYQVTLRPYEIFTMGVRR